MPMVTIKSAIDLFHTLNNHSARTRRSYESIVSEWARFIGAEIGSIGAATQQDAMLYIAHQRSQILPPKPGKKAEKRAEKTVFRKYAMLRTLYRFLAHQGAVPANVFDFHCPPPKKSGPERRQTLLIPFEKVRKILELPSSGTKDGIRDRAALGVLFGGALRRGEVLNLSLDDVRVSPKGNVFLRLRNTKNGEDKDHAIPKWCIRRIVQLYNQRIEEGAGPDDPLFVVYWRRSGRPSTKPLSDSSLYRLFKLYCKEVGLGPEYYTHAARATAITRMLAQGVDHRRVQEFSRHRSIQMVEKYDKRFYSVDESPASELDYEEKINGHKPKTD